MSRVVLPFTRDLSRPGFYLLADNRTVRACLAEASSERHVVEFAVHFRKPRDHSYHVRPLDSDCCTWVMESAVLHQDLARLELQFSNVPVGVSSRLREL